jgi:methylated-DNA-protein-cysteine methyltransferase related protein
MPKPSFYEAVWALVRRVPRGRVVTYGQVATWLGSPRAARAVGYAMFNVDDPKVPWHRVINRNGEISIGGHLHRPDLQRDLLRREGVRLDGQGRIDLGRYGWAPKETPKPVVSRRFLKGSSR